MTLMCQWAACEQPAVTVEDNWRHCGQHLRQHRLFQREEAETELREARRSARGRTVTLRAAIRGLHAAGYSDQEMAQQLLITPGSVKGERQKMGLPANVVLRKRETLKPCGTHSAFNRHKLRGEQPCGACEIGERVYQRMRARARRAAKKTAA